MVNRKKNDPEITQYTLKNGEKYWRLKTYIGVDPETGKAIKVTRSKLKSRKEAQNLRIKLKAQGAENVANKIEKNKEDLTVQDVYEQYKAIHFKDLRESTMLLTESRWKRIKDNFGSSRINKLSSFKIQNWVNKLSDEVVTYKEIANLLHRVIKFALFKKIIDTDPYTYVIIPKKSAKKHRDTNNNFFEREELEEFLTDAKNYNFKIYMYFMLVASLGARRGEILALTWDDIHFEDNTITISKTVAYDRNNKPTINPVKNGVAHTIPMSENLKDDLLKYRQMMMELGDSKKLLFHVRHPRKNTNQPYLLQSKTVDHWIKYVYNFNRKKVSEWNRQHPEHKKKPLKRITPHGLRHTLATLLYEGNPDIRPKDVQFMLGHKSVNTALEIYTHVTQKQKEDIKDSLDKLDF